MNIISIHRKVWSELQARREKLPHAILLIGQQGLGKFELAIRFAAGLLCEAPQENGIACGKCLACNWFEQGNHPDFRLLVPDALAEEGGEAEEGKKKASQQITIDQIRALDDFLNVGTHRDGLRIILINPTEAMNRNTANALLKSLEEPPPSTLFLLVSNEPARLLPTIRSRCQALVVPVPQTDASLAALQSDGLQDAARWLALAGGAPMLAKTLAESQSAWLDTLCKRLSSGASSDALVIAGEMDKLIRDSKGKLGPKQLIDSLQKWLVDLSMASQGLPVRYFIAQQAIISSLAAMIPPVRLIRAYRALTVRRREAEQPLNARLFLEGIFLDYRALFAK